MYKIDLYESQFAECRFIQYNGPLAKKVFRITGEPSTVSEPDNR